VLEDAAAKKLSPGMGPASLLSRIAVFFEHQDFDRKMLSAHLNT
jgi:hypothetical protein